MVRCLRTPSRLRLFDLLFLASVASAASAVSLSSFRLISSNGLPLACIIAYNTPIPGCTNNDFTTGHTCSSTCIAGIETTVSIIQSACDEVDPGDNTVLVLAMNDRLVGALCPNNGNDDTTTTTVRVTASGIRGTPSTTGATSTPTTTSATTSARRFTTIPSSATPSTSSVLSTSFAANPALSKSTAESTSKSTSDSTSESTSTTSPVVTTSGGVPIVTSATSSSKITSTTSAEAAKKTNPFANGGGGSPFDQSSNFSAGAAPLRCQTTWWLATLAATFAAGWTLVH